MRHLFIVLYKVIGLEFYRINAGFFLIATGLCFGFLRKTEHIALGQLFVSTIYLLVIPLVIWFFYSIKVIQFNRQATGLNQNTFLSSFLLAQSAHKVILLFSIALIELLPVVAYGLFLIGIAKVDQQFYSIYIIVCSLVVITAWVAHSLHRSFFYSSGGIRSTLLKRVWDAKFTKPHLQFFIEWVIRNQASLFFGVKLVGCALIAGVARLYVYDAYDERLMSLGVLCAAAANTMIVFQFHRFENHHFKIIRNLPFSDLHRILFFTATFLIICLPEWILLFRFFPGVLGGGRYVDLVAFGLSFVLWSYAMLFLQHTSFDRFVRRIFYCFLILMLLILFQVPLVVFTVLNVLLGVYVIRNHYYNFEFIAGEEI